MSESFAQRYWRTVKKCCCPCIYKEEDQTPLIGKVWDSFKPTPEPGWNQLPKSVQETVKRTSDELQRYAIARKSGTNNGEFGKGPIILSDVTSQIGKSAAAITNDGKDKFSELIFGQQKEEK